MHINFKTQNWKVSPPLIHKQMVSLSLHLMNELKEKTEIRFKKYGPIEIPPFKLDACLL